MIEWGEGVAAGRGMGGEKSESLYYMRRKAELFGIDRAVSACGGMNKKFREMGYAAGEIIGPINNRRPPAKSHGIFEKRSFAGVS